MADSEQNQEDRTEEPTQRRIDEAIRRGDVARSQEIGTFFVLGGVALALLMFGASSARHLALSLAPFIGNADQIGGVAGAGGAARTALLAAAAALAAPLLLMLLSGLAGGLIQHRPLWTFDTVQPKASRISPLAGAKRLFGREAMLQFVKGLAKIGLVGIVVWTVIDGERDRGDSLARMDVVSLLSAAQAMTLKLMGGVLAVFAFVAAGDFLYQRLAWMRRLRMTKQELKQEFKEQEGSPEIKSKRRQIAQTRLKRRMIQQVPKATVVVMNPTHYAVALHYERGMAAPVCVAKGLDSLALRIREIAEKHRVPVVENPPLARALHATAEIDEEIPVEHYRAVAEVIGYVMRLRRRAA